METQIKSLKGDIKSKYKTLVRGSIVLNDYKLRFHYYYNLLKEHDIIRIREDMRTTPDRVLSFEVTEEERKELREYIELKSAGNVSEFSKEHALDREAVSRVINGRSLLKTQKVKLVLSCIKKGR